MKKQSLLQLVVAVLFLGCSICTNAQWTTNGNNIYNSNTANVGIGTGTSISSKFHVTGGAVLFNGTTGSTPVSGAGTRLMWIPSKAAFRAGIISGSNWDNANIGNYSVAMGYDTKASGDYSFAMGLNATASGSNSVCLAPNSTASGTTSLALGGGSTQATGQIQYL